MTAGATIAAASQPRRSHAGSAVTALCRRRSATRSGGSARSSSRRSSSISVVSVIATLATSSDRQRERGERDRGQRRIGERQVQAAAGVEHRRRRRTAVGRRARPGRPSGRRRCRCGTGCGPVAASPPRPTPPRSAAETAARRALAPNQPRRATADYSCSRPDYRWPTGASDGIPGMTRAGRRKFSTVRDGPSTSTSASRTGGCRCVFCLVAFILTFFVTRTIVRYIRSHADSDAPRKWWQPRNISAWRRAAHPPRGDRCDPGHDLRGVDGDIGGRRGSTRIHGCGNLFRDRCSAGARRVRADPSSGGRVLGRGRPNLGGRGVRRGRGRGPADPRLQPAVVLRHRHLARRPLRRGAGRA